MAALSTRGIARLLPADAAAAPPIALNADHELASGRRPCWNRGFAAKAEQTISVMIVIAGYGYPFII